MDVGERSTFAGEAAEWWVRLRSEDLTPREREQFVDWLRESPAHVAEMLRVAEIHDALGRFQRWDQIETGASAEPFVATIVSLRPNLDVAKPAPRTRITRLRVAAAAAAALTVAVLATAWLREAPAGQTIETERGERREVALADGSVVQVGPETRLRVNFTEQQRLVYLERGATLFRVAKNPRRPFIVEMNHTLVRAVGTAFGVEQRGQAVVVTVAEGKVAVMRNDTARPAALNKIPHSAPMPAVYPVTPQLVPQTVDQSLILIAGQQIAVPGTGAIGSVRKVDSERELAWASGRLVFERAPVSEVIATFNRYNQMRLVVLGEALGRREISGVFDASDPESFIAFLASVTPVRVRRDETGTVELTTINASTEGAAFDNSR
jgi:transmembrane sensor